MNKALSSILETVKGTIAQHGFRRLLLAVSGGLDSICLTHFFVTHRNELDVEWLGIAHVHHGLREGTADRDAVFVKNFADKYKCDFYLKKLDGSALKAANGSLEENARDARYDALKSFAAENNADAILTAHHAGDQAETLYLRLRRGVSLVGLQGIYPTRKLTVTASCTGKSRECTLYRPFLNVPRRELAEYARENHLDWCEDESNADVKFARNLIRHERLPQLEELFPEASQQLCKIAYLARKVYIKTLNKANSIFDHAVIPQEQLPIDAAIQKYTKSMAIDLKKVPVDLLHSELFRLWLDAKGFRLAVNQNKICLPNPIPRHFQHKQIILEKRRNILWFCDISSIRDKDNLYLVNDK